MAHGCLCWAAELDDDAWGVSAMFDSLMPGARPRRLWLAIVVIGAIAIVGLFVMFGVMWHDDAPAPS